MIISDQNSFLLRAASYHLLFKKCILTSLHIREQIRSYTLASLPVLQCLNRQVEFNFLSQTLIGIKVKI